MKRSRLAFILLALLAGTNATAQWRPLYNHADRFTALAVIGRDTVVAITESGGRIHRSTDGGASWTFFQTPFANTTFLDVHFPTPKMGYACGGSAFGEHKNVIIRTDDGGLTWDSVTANVIPGFSFHAIHFVDKLTGYVAGDNEQLLKTTDAGETLEDIVDNFILGDITDVFFLNKEKGFISTRYSGIPGNGQARYDLYEISERFTTRFDYSFMDYVDDSDAANHREIHEITFADALNGYAVGGAGTLLRTTDGGHNWTRSTIPPGGSNLTAVSFTSPLVGYTNNAGGIYRTGDGGTTWTVQPVIPAALVHDIVMASDGRTGYAATSAGVYKTTNGGSVAGIAEATPISAFRIHPNPASTVLAVESTGAARITKLSIAAINGSAARDVKSGFSTVSVADLPPGVYCITAWSAADILGTATVVIRR